MCVTVFSPLLVINSYLLQMSKFWLVFSVTLFLRTWQGNCENVLDWMTDDFDFDGIPGAQHEFKVEIAAGKEECFYETIRAGGTLHVSFQVLRDGDGQVALYLTKSDNLVEILHKVDQNDHGAFQYGPVTENGVYAICLDNTMSRMTSQLVYLFVVTHMEDEWSKYAEEMKAQRLTEESLRASLQSVQESLVQAFVHQAESRMHVVRDWYLITDNKDYIQTWSIGECLIIFVSAAIQVFFVRRLFRGYHVTPESKLPDT